MIAKKLVKNTSTTQQLFDVYYSEEKTALSKRSLNDHKPTTDFKLLFVADNDTFKNYIKSLPKEIGTRKIVPFAEMQQQYNAFIAGATTPQDLLNDAVELINA